MLGWIAEYRDSGGGPAAEAFTWSQLLNFGTPAFLIGYAAWVGLQGAAYGVLAVLLLVELPNRLLALALPQIVVFVSGFVLATLGLGQFSLAQAAFSTNMVQFPLWVPVVASAPLALAIGWLWRRNATTKNTPDAFQ